jgi:hypothetical protein
MSLDPADTIEPTETLDFIAGWRASDLRLRCPEHPGRYWRIPGGRP